MVIKCCMGCVAPKRHPGCHGSCQEYQAEKTEYDKRKAEYNRDNAVQSGLTAQRTASILKAQKARKC